MIGCGTGDARLVSAEHDVVCWVLRDRRVSNASLSLKWEGTAEKTSGKRSFEGKKQEHKIKLSIESKTA